MMPMQELWETINECECCALATGRTNVVVGKGNPEADIMIVGEAPGAEEDRTGQPFMGRAGNLLDEALEAAMLNTADVYICNAVKCRPPNNRPPVEDELYACRGYLNSQLWIVKPKRVITLGRISTFELVNPSMTVRKKPFKNFIAQRPYYRHNIQFYPAYHPSYILRSPSHKPEWIANMINALVGEE